MSEFNIGYPHSNTKRIINKDRTIKNKLLAWERAKDFYDGARENGYGGLNYDGRWVKLIPAIIKRYGLSNNSRVLEIGCRKGFFLHDLKLALPKIEVIGIENHLYPILNALETVKEYILFNSYERLPFNNHSFDFIMAHASVYTLNLGGVIRVLKEIERVGKGKSYITLGAYETEEEKRLFMDWTMLGTTVLHKDEWLEVFKYAGYTGDYFFTTAKTLNL